MPSLSAGPTTIEQAISTGDPHGVSALLDSMDDASAIRQLTGCYGGGRHEGDVPGLEGKDDNGLFRMTVPLLHAAYTGNIAMFETVHRAMRAKLRVQQVKVLTKHCSVSIVEFLSTGVFGPIRCQIQVYFLFPRGKRVTGCLLQII